MNTINANQAISQNLLQILTKASIGNLSVGDILQGRVQSLDDGLLLLKLLDGTFFTARVPEGFKTSSGELITLEIGQKINDQLTARIINPDKSPQREGNSIEQPLERMIIEKLEPMVPSQPEKLAGEVLRLIQKKPDLSVDQAVFVVANRMDDSPETLDLITKITQGEFKLHENLQTLKEGISKALLPLDEPLRQAILKPLVISGELDKLQKYIEQILPDTSLDTKEAIVQNIRELLTKALLVEKPAGSPAEHEAFPDVNPKTINEVLETALSALSNPETKDRPRLETEVIRKLEVAVRKAFEDIHTKAENTFKDGPKEGEALIKRLFDDAVLKVEKGAVEDTDIKGKAEALKNVMEFSRKAMELMDGSTKENILPAYKEVDSAFRFFSQASSYDSVLQLPLKINDENTTGELYVMKRRKGSKKLDAENFTLFLSLRTTSLGLIESFLNASGKCLTISFRVEQEHLVKLIKDNHRVLYDSLLRKGYKLAEMKCRKLDDSATNLLNAASNSRHLLGLQASVDVKI